MNVGSLPAAPATGGTYASTIMTPPNTTLLYVSGVIPTDEDDNIQYAGPIDDRTIKKGKEAAALAALNAVSAVKNACGDKFEPVQIMKLNGFVNSAPGFTRLSEVMDGASDVLIKWFGKDAGKGARTTTGTQNLPLNASTELDLIVAVKPKQWVS